jgi:hypothetical protein
MGRRSGTAVHPDADPAADLHRALLFSITTKVRTEAFAHWTAGRGGHPQKGADVVGFILRVLIKIGEWLQKPEPEGQHKYWKRGSNWTEERINDGTQTNTDRH